MQKLAEITRVSSLGELVQDALRTYEWIIFEQSVGRPVVSLPGKMLYELQKRDEEIRMLPKLFENQQEVKQYFVKAA